MGKYFFYEYNGSIYGSKNKAKWAVFLDLLGVEYEPNPFEYIDFKVKCYGKRGEIYDEPFDLYLAVCGMNDVEKNDIVKMFCLYGENSKEKYYTWKNNPESVAPDYDHGADVEIKYPTLIVGMMPSGLVNVGKRRRVPLYEQCEAGEECGHNLSVQRYSYETIDGDVWGAWPCVKDGKFYLLGEDDEQYDDDMMTLLAFKFANEIVLDPKRNNYKVYRI